MFTLTNLETGHATTENLSYFISIYGEEAVNMWLNGELSNRWKLVKNTPFEGNTKAKAYFNSMLNNAAAFIGANATQDEKEVFAKKETENWLARMETLKTKVRKSGFRY